MKQSAQWRCQIEEAVISVKHQQMDSAVVGCVAAVGREQAGSEFGKNLGKILILSL